MDPETPEQGPIQDVEPYRPARFVSCHKVDMECHHITSCVHLYFVGVVFVLVAAALIQVALVICVRYFDGVLDRSSWV